MTLNEFVEHIKHKSLTLIVHCYYRKDVVFEDTIGTYINSVFKEKYGNIEVDIVYPHFKQDDTFLVLLDPDDLRDKTNDKKNVYIIEFDELTKEEE